MRLTLANFTLKVFHRENCEESEEESWFSWGGCEEKEDSINALSTLQCPTIELLQALVVDSFDIVTTSMYRRLDDEDQSRILS